MIPIRMLKQRKSFFESLPRYYICRHMNVLTRSFRHGRSVTFIDSAKINIYRYCQCVDILILRHFIAQLNMCDEGSLKLSQLVSKQVMFQFIQEDNRVISKNKCCVQIFFVILTRKQTVARSRQKFSHRCCKIIKRIPHNTNERRQQKMKNCFCVRRQKQ